VHNDKFTTLSFSNETIPALALFQHPLFLTTTTVCPYQITFEHGHSLSFDETQTEEGIPPNTNPYAATILKWAPSTC
jgi:hypothetical protein